MFPLSYKKLVTIICLTILFFGHLGNFQFLSYICLEPLAQSLSHLLQVFIQMSFLGEVFPSHPILHCSLSPNTSLLYVAPIIIKKENSCGVKAVLGERFIASNPDIRRETRLKLTS